MERQAVFFRSSHMQYPSQFLINRLSAAESIVTLLGQLDGSRFPWEERIAVGACQAKALDAWFEAHDGERSGRCHRAVLQAVAEARPLAAGLRQQFFSSAV
jgi:hypothetical protein